jgi:hypothetical protein
VINRRAVPPGEAALAASAALSNSFVPNDGMPTWLRLIADWNPISALVAASRHPFGNPSVALAEQSWPLRHPATVIWSVAILAVFIPLATWRYQKTAHLPAERGPAMSCVMCRPGSRDLRAAPGGPVRGGIDPGLTQDLPDRGCGDLHSKGEQFPVHPSTAPSLSRSLRGSSRSSAHAFVTLRYASRRSAIGHHRAVIGDNGGLRARGRQRSTAAAGTVVTSVDALFGRHKVRRPRPAAYVPARWQYTDLGIAADRRRPVPSDADAKRS